MAKLRENDADDVLYDGESLTVRAMRRRSGEMPAREWFDNLDSKGKGQFLAAVRVLETTIRSGRPPAGRAEAVKTAKHGLWELKITKPSSTPPHLRSLYVRDGSTLWLATGFTKQKNKLEKKDIKYGESVTQDWMTGREGTR